MEEFVVHLEKKWSVIEEKVFAEIILKFENNNNFKEINFADRYIEPFGNNYGVYVFKVFDKDKFTLENFENIWKSESKNYNCPRIIRTRFSKIVDPKKTNVLYVGKSEKLFYRIKQHCFDRNESKTYGLKLSNKLQLHDIVSIKYCYFEFKELKNIDKNIAQFIITSIEKKLRNYFEPWIVKQ